MPAINFKPEFRRPILDGTKVHTIRRRREDGKDPRPGQMLQLYVGQRTKHCEKLAEHECLSVRPVELVISTDAIQITLDDEPINDRLLSFARNEGFNSINHMNAWFWRAASSAAAHNGIVQMPALLIQWGETDY